MSTIELLDTRCDGITPDGTRCDATVCAPRELAANHHQLMRLGQASGWYITASAELCPACRVVYFHTAQNKTLTSVDTNTATE